MKANPSDAVVSPFPPRRVGFVSWFGAIVTLFAALAAPPLLAADGVISGTVSNAATRNLLAGARVEVVGLGLPALTDESGRFVLNGLPAGTHEVMVSYIGL